MSDHAQDRRVRNRLPIAALILLAIGIVLLLNTTGVVGWGIWLKLIPLWPVILIAVGLNMILGPRFPLLSALVVAVILAGSVGAAYLSHLSSGNGFYDDLRVISYSAPVGETETLALDIDFAAGSLVIDSLVSADGDKLLTADFDKLESRVDESRSGSVTSVNIPLDAPGIYLKSDDDGWDIDIDLLRLFRSLGNIDWKVGVASDVAVRLDIEGGAADIDLYLHDVTLEVLDMEVGAADVQIVLPANAGQTNVYITAGAADIDIIVPEGVAARINADSALSSIDVNAARFPMMDGAYRSPDYRTAPNRVDIKIRTAASNVSVR